MDSNNWRVKRDPSELPARDQTPRRETPRRDFGSSKSSGSGLEQRWSDRGTPTQASSRDSKRQPLNSQQADLAVDEGRRVYVGNLPYEATVKDIETLFVDLGKGVEAINMSVDLMTGRNPSYCFVDFTTKELAETAMVEYDGKEFLRRPLKVKPGVKSSTGSGRFNKFDVPGSGSPSSPSPIRMNNENMSPAQDRWRRMEAPEQLHKAVSEGRRLYVGGLPQFPSNGAQNAEIQALFDAEKLNVDIIGNQISPHESKRSEKGNHYYCFVDLVSADDTETAVAALNGLERWGWRLKVSRASGTPTKLGERRRVYVSGLPEFDGPEATEAGIKELFAGYDVRSVSRLLQPREPKSEEGNRCYCFVEVADEEQREKAIAELDWKEMWGWKVRVKPATGTEKQPVRRGWGA
jgi:RNA recognition motif-containing protein